MIGHKFDYTLFSDGGSSRGGVAAGACIVDGHHSGRRRGAMIFLGEATNNEAEIAGALLGFSMVRAAAAKRESEADPVVHWVADSEYTLKSAKDYIRNWQKNGWKTAAKEPVKNQGLWRAYLSISRGFTISFEHVRGHTGHPENELCDLAANWAKEHAEDSLDEGQRKVHVPDTKLPFWFLLDGRPFLEQLREGGEEQQVHFLLEDEFRAIAAKRTEADEGGAIPASDPEDEIRPALKELRELKKRLEKQSKKSGRLFELASEIGDLMSRWEKPAAD